MPRRQPSQLDLLEDTSAGRVTPSSEIYSRTLSPGFLIGLSTAVRGGVHYKKETIQAEHRVRSGAEKAVWKTERTINDPDEYKKANQIRMKARMCVVNECAISAFGLLCPDNNLPRLELAVKEANRIVATFNRTARQSRVTVYVIKGRIARDDVEAAKAIKSEVRELLDAMSSGIKTLNAEAVREAASKAKQIETMLSPDAATALKGAVSSARIAARKIVKAGEEAAGAIDRESIRAITEARTAFLDIEEGEATEVQSPDASGRAIDLEPEVEAPAEAALTGRTPSEAPAESGKPKKGTTKRYRAGATA
jgi:hypothetical protein